MRQMLNDSSRTGYDYIDYEIRIKGSTLPLRLRVSKSSLAALPKDKNWPKIDFTDTLTRLAPLVHDAEISDAAIDQILTKEKTQEVEGLIGQDRQNASSVSLPFLVQLNITRFGTMSLVAIGIGLLSPLYRFSARLAVFYQARADAFRFHTVAYKD